MGMGDAAERLRHTADVACSCPAASGPRSAWAAGTGLQGRGALGAQVPEEPREHIVLFHVGGGDGVAEGLWEVGALRGTGEALSSEESQPQPARASKDTEPPPAS